MKPIPILIDAVESAMFPETTFMHSKGGAGGATIRLSRHAHWRGCDFSIHYRARAAKVGVYRVARQLRKQGIGLQTALSVLANR